MAKKTKKKGFKRFFLGLLIYSVVFLGLAFLGLNVFWDFIDAYELSRPKNTIAPYVEQLTIDQLAAADTQLIAQIDHYIQSEEACKEYIAGTLTEEISYAQNVAESSDTQMVYMVLHGGKAIGKSFAVNSSTAIVHSVGKCIHWLHSLTKPKKKTK